MKFTDGFPPSCVNTLGLSGGSDGSDDQTAGNQDTFDLVSTRKKKLTGRLQTARLSVTLNDYISSAMTDL